MPIIVAIGTASQLCALMYFVKNSSGTKPWISAPTATPPSTYGSSFLKVPHPSFAANVMRFWSVLISVLFIVLPSCALILMYFSIFNLPIIMPAKTPSNIPVIAYKIASFQPKSPPIITKATSLTSGEVIMKENAIPSGISASMKPRKIGIEEQEQNGVIAPKLAAAKLPSPNRDFAMSFWNLLAGKKLFMKAITDTTEKISVRILRLS